MCKVNDQNACCDVNNDKGVVVVVVVFFLWLESKLKNW